MYLYEVLNITPEDNIHLQVLIYVNFVFCAQRNMPFQTVCLNISWLRNV